VLAQACEKLESFAAPGVGPVEHRSACQLPSWTRAGSKPVRRDGHESHEDVHRVMAQLRARTAGVKFHLYMYIYL
jgi:hypothetical protein